MPATHRPWNVIVVVSDTCRPAYLGPYGNDWVHTPHLDRFAAQSVTFNHAHPEALPTIPMRRTIHTGRRAYPFADYDPVPWDNVYLPGWQPMSPSEPTIAETLAQQGYHTGFYADVPHYFVPGMNFTRGFRQWEYIRGQAEDRYQATVSADPALLTRYLSHEERLRAHLVNVRPELPEETWPTARTFRGAMRFLEANGGRNPFYLYVDTFSPHETWEAPLHYYLRYGKLQDREPICLTVPYGPVSRCPMVGSRLDSIRANYAGLITMVDTWFGRLLDTVERLGLSESTLIVFTSDHGTNFADNPEGIMGKPWYALYPGTMDIPLIMRTPSGEGAGSASDELVSALDIPATILDAATVRPLGEIQGQSLLPLAASDAASRKPWASREYLTCRYGNAVWYRDQRNWFYDTVRFDNPRLFDMESDPACQENLTDGGTAAVADRIALAKERLLADANGALPFYDRRDTTDALGRPVFEKE